VTTTFRQGLEHRSSSRRAVREWFGLRPLGAASIIVETGYARVCPTTSTVTSEAKACFADSDDAILFAVFRDQFDHSVSGQKTNTRRMTAPFWRKSFTARRPCSRRHAKRHIRSPQMSFECRAALWTTYRDERMIAAATA
jgi:hypothetical protein